MDAQTRQTNNPNISVEIPSNRKGMVKFAQKINGEKAGSISMSHEVYDMLNSSNPIPPNTRFLFCPISSPDLMPNAALEVLYNNFDYEEDGKRYMPIFFQFEGNIGHRDAAINQMLPLVEQTGLYSLKDKGGDYQNESAKPKVIMTSLSKGGLIGNWGMIANKNFNKLIDASVAFGVPMSGTPMGDSEEIRKALVYNQKNPFKKLLGNMFAKIQDSTTKGVLAGTEEKDVLYDTHCVTGQRAGLENASLQEKASVDEKISDIAEKTLFIRAEIKEGYLARKLLKAPTAAAKLQLFKLTKGIIPEKESENVKENTAKKQIRAPKDTAKAVLYQLTKGYIPKGKDEIQRYKEDLLILKKQSLACLAGNYVLNQMGYKSNDGITPNKKEDEGTVMKHVMNVDGSHVADLMKQNNLREAVKWAEARFQEPEKKPNNRPLDAALSR